MKSASRYWMIRAYIATRALLVVVNMMIDPTNLTRKAVDINGALGWLAIAALGAVALIAIFDVLINDLCPERFVLPSFLKRRHMVYMALSLGLMSMCMVAYKGGALSIVSYFWIDACFAAGVAVADLFARHHTDQRKTDRRSTERRDHDRRSIA